MSGLFLPHSVWCCHDNGVVILMDLRTDQYLQLTDDQSRLFHDIHAAPDLKRLEGRAADYANWLLRRGLLTQSAAAGRPPAFTCPQVPRASLMEGTVMRSGGRMTPILPAMVAAALSAWVSEKAHRFDRVIETVRRRKTALTARPQPAGRAQDLAHRFHAAAPYLFTIQDQCRFRSLALLRFLAFHNIAADWVFGVRLAPFGAHCWVEQAGTLLNEDMVTAREYRTILVV